MPADVLALLSLQNLALLLGLSLLLGLAFEDTYCKPPLRQPGGIRTFPMLAVTGAALYLLDPVRLFALLTGLLALALWLQNYVQRNAAAAEQPAPGMLVPVSNLLAYLLGPLTFTLPHWTVIGLTVLTVMLIGSRERLHRLAGQVPFDELATAGKFLVLSGIILPLLPNHPVTDLTPITPYQAWLAVVVICGMSYGSYLVQRFVPGEHGLLVSACMGGLYSSTATTVVLSRQARREPGTAQQIPAAIVAATAMMHLRIGAIIAVFNYALIGRLLPVLGVLLGFNVLIAFLLLRTAVRATPPATPAVNRNPLELNTAFTFAAAFVAVALVTRWVAQAFGSAGILWLAALVGFTDIDPFIVNLAQGGAAGTDHGGLLLAAALIAMSSNNALKAIYAVVFGGWQTNWRAAAGLSVLSVIGLGCAAFVV